MSQAHTRDFTQKRPPVHFTIAEERFNCYKALDMDQLRRFANMARELRVDATDANDADQAAVSMEKIGKIGDLMRIVLKKESATRFIAILNPDEEKRESDDFEPIDPFQLLDIVKWLMEIYTKRPTEPSSTSQPGSTNGETGTYSTAGALPTESSFVHLTPQTV